MKLNFFIKYEDLKCINDDGNYCGRIIVPNIYTQLYSTYSRVKNNLTRWKRFDKDKGIKIYLKGRCEKCNTEYNIGFTCHEILNRISVVPEEFIKIQT